MLDGGYKKWVEDGYEVTNVEPEVEVSIYINTVLAFEGVYVYSCNYKFFIGMCVINMSSLKQVKSKSKYDYIKMIFYNFLLESVHYLYHRIACILIMDVTCFI
mgnify:CR=1 FL=1